MRTLWGITATVWLILFAGAAYASGVADPFPEAALSYIVKVDSGILWAHNPYRRLPPASLTKIITALLVLEKGRLDEVISVSRSAAGETGARLGLRTGERMKVSYLLAATILTSANDACRLLAEYVGGTETDFVARMNRRAKELGMESTHFTNASGHDNPNHYSTAHDLLILAETALRNRLFAELTGMIDTHIDTADGRRIFYLVNKNELVGRYPGAVGVKTGYTLRAGKCLIALVKRKEGKVLLVLLNAPDRWWSALEILDRAFDWSSQQKIHKKL
jgi:D-alanyl-D-alanine carboxypeptidase (penicillin-binding protein 5/6)